MNPQTLLNRPKPQIVPKITKISGLVDSSNEIKRSSTKLRKVFEKGTYQKKTQLTTLNRYKKRLDAIQKQNDKRFSQRSKLKVKLPDIKKYAGSFFTAGSTSDPLKSIAALAAFNSVSKAGKGDWLGAVGPGLVATGLLFGPGLIKGGVNRMFSGGKSNSQSSPSIISGSPYSQTKAGKAYAGMQAERNLPKWAQKAVGGSSSRFAASNERVFQGTANIGDRARVLGRKFGFGGIGGAAENIAARGGGVAAEAATARAGGTLAAKAGGVGARAVPLLGTALNIGLSAYRFSQGDVVGGILSAVSAIPVIGWAALGVDLAREFGAFDGTIIGRKGQDQLKEQTQSQKELTNKKESGGTLTFRKTLNSYEKTINKFEEFAKGFKGSMGMNNEQIQQTAAKIEDLGGGSTPISTAGYEFTKQSSFSQYLTGDPSSGTAYDPSHGTVSNYHDHLAFKDRETARRAYDFLKSKGLTVTELGVSSGHTAGSAHYEGRAFDVPGAQWGGTGAIGQTEYAGSAKVRAFMNDFYNLENQKSGSQPMRSPSPVTAVTSPLSTSPQRTAPQITPTPAPRRASIASYTSYDSRSQVGQIIPLPITIPQQQQQQMMPSQSSGMMMSGPSEQDLLNSFYKRVLLNTVA
jgi:uncharacterized membrane-anchored protein YhcB (DUF1043 family)